MIKVFLLFVAGKMRDVIFWYGEKSATSGFSPMQPDALRCLRKALKTLLQCTEVLGMPITPWSQGGFSGSSGLEMTSELLFEIYFTYYVLYIYIHCLYCLYMVEIKMPVILCHVSLVCF